MSEQRLRRKGSNRRSSKKRRRRRSSISVSSTGGIDEEEESILKVIENDNDDDFEINMNESDTSRSNDEDLDSEEEERRERRRRAERRIHEEIMMEKINQCKELIDSVKKHTWKMSKKLDVLKKAKAYVEKFEGKLSRSQGYQQRGKQLLKQLSRSWKNGMASLVPWEMKIKQIEGHFGSVVASYFVFLRWLLWISVWLTILPTCFIIIPELIAGESYGSSIRKSIPDDELDKAYDLQTIWNAEGVVKYSLVFYGYYGNAKTIGNGYRLPLAYLLINLASFAYSFVVVLKTMASNSRNSRMSNSDDEYTFAWKLFTEWDYMITNHDTATTKHASITTVFKETILEVKVKSRSENKWKILSIRIFSNVSIALLLALSTYIIQLSVERSRQLEIKQRNDPNYQAGAWEENELTVVMTLISMIFPTFLDIFALIEKFHPRTSLQLMLGRIFVLNLLNLYTLFIALYNKQQDLLASITSLQSNITVQNNCSTTWLNTTSIPSVSTIAPTDVTTLPTVNVTSTVCVNVTDIPTKVKEFCWETMIGQEVFKLTVLDMVALIAQHLVTDVLRTYFVRYCNNICCWDIEKNMPEYPEFKTAENLLHLISNQGVIWLGVLFCPGLALLNLIKLYILVYFRCWTVLCYNVPEERIFRASRSNNFYYALLLVMLFLCMLPPLFAIVVIEPSPQCGPFSGQKRMYHVLTETMETELPSSVNSVIQYAASPGVILPIFMLLGMTIYYLVSMGHSLKDANNELRMQLEYERTEGRRKVYAMADARHETKGRAKGKGWHTARSSIEKKTKSVEKTAMSVIQAMRPAKAGQAKSRVHPKPALSKLMENGSEDATNPGQSLLERLRAAQKLQTVPVAVIKGKQSLKANTAATRERNKIAAQSAFRSALLEYTRNQAQHDVAAADDDIIDDPTEAGAALNQNRSNSAAKSLQKFRRAVAPPPRNGSRGAPPSIRQEDEITEDNDSQGEEITEPAERPKQSQNRFWGHSKTKQLKKSDVTAPSKRGAQSLQAKNVLSVLQKSGSRHTKSSIEDSVSVPITDKARKSIGAEASSKKPLTSQKMPEKRRRLSVSSYVDESGYLSPFSEESDEDDDDDDDNVNDENNTETDVLEECNDDDVADNDAVEDAIANESVDDAAIEMNDDTAVDGDVARQGSVIEVHTGQEQEVKKRRGLRLPFSRLHRSKLKENSSHDTSLQQSPKGQGLNSKSKSATKTTAEINVTASAAGNSAKQSSPAKSKRSLSRVLSSGTITGPVPEIMVQDFSESPKHSTVVDPNEASDQPDETQELKNISPSHREAAAVIEKSKRNNSDARKTLFIAGRESNSGEIPSNEAVTGDEDSKEKSKDITSNRKLMHTFLTGASKRTTGKVTKTDDNNDFNVHEDMESKLNGENESSKIDEDDEEEEGNVDDNEQALNGTEDEESIDETDKALNETEAVNVENNVEETEDGESDTDEEGTGLDFHGTKPKTMPEDGSSKSHPFKSKSKNNNGNKAYHQQSQQSSVRDILGEKNQNDRPSNSKLTNSTTSRLKKKEISKPLSESSETTGIKTQPHLPEKRNETEDGTAKSKLLAKIQKVGGKSILQPQEKTATKIPPKAMIPPEHPDKTETNGDLKNKGKSPKNKPALEPEEGTSVTVFEDELKNIQTLPRLKRLSRGKIPRKKPITKSLLLENVQSRNKDDSNSVHSSSNKNEKRKSHDTQTTLLAKELDLNSDETSPKETALDIGEDEISDSEVDEFDDDGVNLEDRDDENKESDKKILQKHIQENDDSENSETDSVPGDSENEDLEETAYDVDKRIRAKKNIEKSKVLIPANSQHNKIDDSNSVKTKPSKSSIEKNIPNTGHPYTTNSKNNFQVSKTKRKMEKKEVTNIDGENDLQNEEVSTESEVVYKDLDGTDSDTSEMDEDGSENDENSNGHDVIDSDEDVTEKDNDVMENEEDATENDDSLIVIVDDSTPENAFESDQALEDKSSGTSPKKDKVLARVKKNKKHGVNNPEVNMDTGVNKAQNNPQTVINIETDHQEDISETEIDHTFQNLEASSDFYNKYGYHRRDRPSLVPVSSDDDEMSQSYQDYLKFIKSQERKPRQISDYPNFSNKNLVTVQPEAIQDIIPVMPRRPFTILAITNGKLDLDVEDVVIDIDEEGEKEKTTVPQASSSTAVNKVDETNHGSAKLLQKFQN